MARHDVVGYSADYSAARGERLSSQLKQKAVEKRAAERTFNFDFSKYDVQVGDKLHEHLTKRALGFLVLDTAIRGGIDPEDLAGHLGRSSNSWLIKVPGALNAEDFLEAASNLPRKPKMTRFFVSEEDLVRMDGHTCAIGNQWAIKDVPALEQIANAYPNLYMHIKKAGL